MATFRFKSSIALLLIGFVCGFCTSQLFTGCNHNPPETKKAEVVNAKDLRDQVDKVQIGFRNKISLLKRENEQLSEKLSSTQTELKKAKLLTAKKETRIRELASQKGFLTRELSGKSDQTNIDSVHDSDCDLLITEVNAYLEENKRKDSLYDEQIQTLDYALHIKDSIIQNNEAAYHSLNQIFDNSIKQQSLLQKENLQLRKWMKRQRVKNKLFTIGTIALSGFAANYIIRH